MPHRLTAALLTLIAAVVPAAASYYTLRLDDPKAGARWQRIYKWSNKSGHVSTVRDQPLDPVNLAFDHAGNLLVVSYAGEGTVYSFRPGDPGTEIAMLEPQPVVPRPGLVPVLPVSDWRVNPQLLGRPGRQYVSPDDTTFLPADPDFVSGGLSWGVKSSALLRSFGLAMVAPGKPVYLTSEAEIATYQATVAPDGTLSNFKLFANQGGESVAVDSKGNVYIAAGQIYVYSPEGKLIEAIDVPERPTQLVFGGKTLFIPARTSLYAIR